MAKILQRSRYVASASLSAAVTVNASSTNSAITTLSSAISKLPQNSIVRASLLASAMQTDAGGAAFLSIQNAALVADSGAVSGPAFTGSPLGLANGARFQGELRFHDTDCPDATFGIQLQVLVKNADTVAHNVTTLNITLEIEIVTFDAPVYAENLVGI